MAAFLDRLGRAAARRRWWVIGGWVVLVLAIGGVAKAADGKTQDTFRIPGTQSQQTADLLSQRFPSQSGDVATVVFEAPHGTVRDAANAAAIAQTQQRIGALPHVGGHVLGPATPAAGSAFVGAGGTIAYARVQYDQKAGTLPSDTFTR
ncbi:MAG TPA: hypothetical protein VGU73_03770, partial [Acidimicrobiia bacterium]|nr:hypothetical protein [Acidimicrobiia bacterium]